MIYFYVKNVIDKKKAKSLVNFIKKNHDGLEKESDTAIGRKYSKTYTINYGKIRKKLGNIPDLKCAPRAFAPLVTSAPA